jgi:two-component system, response regulator YesN
MEVITMNPQNNIDQLSLEQRDFWKSLQLDILSSNYGNTEEFLQAFLERNLFFSLLFRGYSVLEMSAFQSLFHSKDYGYLILLELTEPKKTGSGSFMMNEFELHQFLKEYFSDKTSLQTDPLATSYHCILGPLLSNRVSLLISLEELLPEDLHREQSLSLCHELIPLLEEHFHAKVTAGIGSIHNLSSIYPSFTSALASLSYSNTNPIIFYSNLKDYYSTNQFDSLLTQKHLVEAIRARKAKAYDYFGLLMDFIRPMSDSMKRNKILELLVLANNAIDFDCENSTKSFDFMNISRQLMGYYDDQLIDFAYQTFVTITSYTKPQNSIDYSNHIVKATREYLENHYADDISLEAMAEQVNISPQYFSKLIKKTTGFNFIDWLSMLRVKKAKELLTTTDFTVKEVCFMVGYKDPNYFSRIFKKRIGITPSEFVKANSFLNNKN